MIALKIALREFLNNKKYWSFFIANVTIGLIGFIFIVLFKTAISDSINKRSKTLLSSDIAISGRRALTKEEEQKIKVVLKNQITQTNTLRELYSMGRVNNENRNRSRLVFIKSIKAPYPLIGSIKLTNGELLDKQKIDKMQKSPYVVISKEVAHQFKLKIQDTFELGEQKFTVHGVIESDSTSSLRGVGLAPKVYIGDAFLEGTGLIKSGSIAFYSTFYLLEKDIDPEKLKNDLYQAITDPAIKVSTPKNSSEQLSRIVNNLSNYLGLIGIIALLISCVGVSYLFQSYLLERLNQIGVFKSIGISQANLYFSYILIIFTSGFVSTLLTLGACYVFLPLAISSIEEWLNFKIQIGLNKEMLMSIISIGIVSNLLICLPLLSKVFHTKTIDLLNAKINFEFKKFDLLKYAPSLFFLWSLAVWQANSIKVGSIFIGAMILIFGCVFFNCS